MTTGTIVKVTMHDSFERPTVTYWLAATDDPGDAFEVVRRATPADWLIEVHKQAPEGLLERYGLVLGNACRLPAPR
jgi:hypothetical protein